MGGLTLLMWGIRFIAFTIYESPKFHMGKGRDEEAVKVVHEVARRNGKTSALTVEDLKACESLGSGTGVDTTASAAVKRQLEKINLTHVRALFSTKQMAFSTAMIMTVWAFIGLGYPLYNAFLPYIQATRGFDYGDGSTYITYRNSLIIAVLGVPGALIGGAMVEIKKFGRRGTLGLATTLTGVILYGSTTATNSNALLGWNCGFSVTSNIMYSVLYAYTPEIFPTKVRAVVSYRHGCCVNNHSRIEAQATLSQRHQIESLASWHRSSPCSQISRLPPQSTRAAHCSSQQVSSVSSCRTRVKARQVYKLQTGWIADWRE